MAEIPVRIAAHEAGVSALVLYRLIDSGELPARREGDEIVVDPYDVRRVMMDGGSAS